MRRILFYCLLFIFLPSLAQARIVFKSYRDVNRSLYVMDDDGSNVQRLTDGGSNWSPVWSPDGKQIAFSKSLTVEPKQPQKEAIFIINSDGSNEHRLTDDNGKNLNGNRLFETSCSWSLDGQHIAFDSVRSGKPNIWTINLTTKKLRQLTRTDSLTTEPAWSPDGKYIAYRDDSPNGRFTVYVMRANGDDQRELVKGEFLRRRSFPRWAPDSQSVVYMEVTLGQDVGRFVLVSRKAVIHNIKSDKRQIVDTPNNWIIHSACFMGSKQMLISAKDSKADPSQYDLYRYHLVTGKIVNLTNTPEDDFSMDWISDDVLSVTPHGKKKVTWGTLKK